MSQAASTLIVLAILAGAPGEATKAAREQAVLPEADAATQALRERRWAEAVRLADQVLAADPARTEARRLRGFARARLEDRGGALADFFAAVAADPRDAEAWHGAGKTLRMAGDLPAARAANERALELLPDTPDYLVERGVERFLAREFTAALAAFDRVGELRPNYPGIQAYRAEVLLFLRDAPGARAAAEEGLRREPGYGIHRINLAHAALFAGEWERARELYLACADLIDMDGVTPGRELVPLDFAKMRAAGVKVDGMAEIEALLKAE